MKILIKEFDKMTRDRLYDCLKLRNEVFVVEQNCVYLDCDGKDKEALHLMALEEGQLIGYLRLLKPGFSYEESSIGRVVVEKNNRKKGLARKMMIQGIDYLNNTLNCDCIRISAQLYLESFYESLGFKRVSENYLEDDIMHLEMLFCLA